MRIVAVLPALLLLGACGGAGGGDDTTMPPPTGSSFTDPVVYSSVGTASLFGAQEISAVTRHQAVIGGTTLDYTATAGHLTAVDPSSSAPEASFFYVAYTLDGADPATRPVTFFYNGGPGSASVWLHLGSWAPKRLVTHAPSTALPTPLEFADNAESLLDVSDLVFVDAVGTGFSEAIAPNVNRSYWSTDADAAIFRDFILRYVAANQRDASPKLLYGESYGTTRSAILASLLESAGTSLAGVVLQSSILDYNTNCGVVDPRSVSCYGYIPSYAAVGAWLGLVQPPEPVAQLPAYMDRMRAFASTQYDPAVREFLGSFTPAPPELVSVLAADTGMPGGQWNFRFNMDPTYFHDNLVPGSVIGYYDGRMVAQRGTPLASEEDPSSTYYDSSFATTIVSYLSNDLHYTTPSAYTMLGTQVNVWDYAHAGLRFPDAVPDLAAAMTLDPKLRVFSANGYHDLVTPFYLTEADLARLGGSPNVTIRFYQGGHMTYLDDVARVAERADLAAFYRAAGRKSLAAMVPTPSAAAPRETPPSLSAMPSAVFETKVHGPSLPESMRGLAPTPPTEGKAFEAEVEQRLRDMFDAAHGHEPGRLTKEEARAAGLGFIATHFDEIDAARTGSISFGDLQRYLAERDAQPPR
ncbi:MAG TPA: peptidase S1 [Usitatibacter sp.]|nr:peptidase S1 [Usitatibacter sp.]